METTEQILDQIKSIHTDIMAKVGADGSITKELKSEIAALHRQADALDLKLVERHGGGGDLGKSITEELQENDDIQRIMRNKGGRGVITFKSANAARLWERKSILESGQTFVTPGVLDIDRRPGIVLEARRALRVRDVLTARPTALPMVYWLKVNSPLKPASPMMQAESLVKYENAVTFTTAQSTIQTVATFIRASRQILDDFAELGGFLQTGLPYYVNRQEETQLLSGDNTGNNLNGLIPQATSFDPSLLSASAGYTFLDQISACQQQISSVDEIDPSFIILNTRDFHKIRRIKDGFGRYIMGDPQAPGNPSIWGLTTVPTNSITAGTFLVGSGDPAAAEIRDRMEMILEISTEDADNFQRNMVTIRAEKRMTLCVLRPASYITGTFASSPS